jgi:hypothetical protein
MRTIEEMVLAFLTERRLTDSEAAAVMKTAKTDSRFAYLADQWSEPAMLLSGPATHRLQELVRKKVLTWMDKYQEKHSARALFTGQS